MTSIHVDIDLSLAMTVSDALHESAQSHDRLYHEMRRDKRWGSMHEHARARDYLRELADRIEAKRDALRRGPG